MLKSLHYYVLSLSNHTNNLYEAFRSDLIQVENRGFPVTSPGRENGQDESEHRCELTRRVDRRFAQYFEADPLRLVVVGEHEMQVAFQQNTAHRSAIIGRIETDHVATDPRVLGQIVWPLVREQISGVQDWALTLLRESTARNSVTSGLEAVARATASPKPIGLIPLSRIAASLLRHPRCVAAAASSRGGKTQILLD